MKSARERLERKNRANWSILVLVFVGIVGNAFADLSQLAGVPPTVMEDEVTVVYGAKSEVIVRARTGTLQQVTIIVREAPQWGTLEGPVPVPDNPAAVKFIYTHDGVSPSEVDQILVAARVKDGPISIAAPVTLKVTKQVPDLVMPLETRFAPVRVGRRGEELVVIENQGEVDFFGEVTLPAPWTVPIGFRELSIPAGEKVEVPIFFRSDEVGRKEAWWVIDEESTRGKILLKAEATPAFSASPARIDLEPESDGADPVGVLTLASHAPFEQEVTLIGDRGLQIPDRITLMPNAELEIPVRLPAPGSVGFRGEILVRGHLHDGRVAVVAASTPALLQTDLENDVVDFGVVESGSTAEFSFTFKNVGGLPAVAKLTCRPPFRVSGFSEGLRVMGGGSQEVVVTADTSSSGKQAGRITLAYEAGTLEIPILMEVSPTPGMQAMVQPGAMVEPVKSGVGEGKGVKPSTGALAPPKLGGRPIDLSESSGSSSKTETAIGKSGIAEMSPEESRDHAMDSLKGESMLDAEYFNDVPRVGEITLLKATKSSLSLSWDSAPVGTVGGYIVESAHSVYDPEKRVVQTKWIPQTQEIEIDVKDGKVLTKLTGMQPGISRKLRVLSVSPDERPSLPSEVVTFQTLLPGDKSLMYWFMLLGLMALIGAWFIWRKKLDGSLGEGAI